jgi:signal transduction histidine kinase
MSADETERPEVAAIDHAPLLDRRRADRPVTDPTDAETALRRTADRLARLQAVTASLGAAVDVGAIGHIITRALLDTTGAAAAAVRVLANDTDGRPVLQLVDAEGYPPSVLAAPLVSLEAPLPSADALRAAMPVFLETQADWEARYAPYATLHRRGGLEAAAAVPCANEDVTCVLMLSFPGPHAFDADERAMLHTIADQAAIALGRARLAERAARQARRTAFLADASRALSLPTDVDEMLALIARLPVPELADYTMVYQPGRDGLVHRVARAHIDPAKEAALDTLERHYPLAADSELPAARVMRTQQAVFTPHLNAEDFRASAPDARYLELVAPLEVRSGITIPLVARGRSLGAMIFALTTPSARSFDDDDFAIAYAFAERAALALDTARLLAEARQARTEAEAASRAREDFVARMGHELRTPLNAIGGYADLIEMGVRGPVTDAQREDLHRLKRAQRHLLGLINQVLAYARVGRGGVAYEPADVPVDDALRSVEALIAPQIGEKGIVYTYNPCDPEATVRADAVHLRQIVLNLLSNAVKFTAPGGHVEVSCELGDHTASIRVRDTGRGIAPDQIEAVFEAFVQATPAPGGLHEGVGLGLAISRQLARGMGGDLTADSTLGVGSTFTLTLPRA